MGFGGFEGESRRKPPIRLSKLPGRRPAELRRPPTPNHPTGTVTFLFTDIEGSTRLLQSLGDARATEVFEEHRRLLRQAIATSGGQELQDQGDGFLFVFQRAYDAVLAAVAAQQAINTGPWPDGAKLRVRMGLHTGEPVATPEGYVGLDVHRAARISAAGHGGQVLFSQATRELIDRQLPAGTEVRDLGAHRLKDLQKPEKIFQLVHADLLGDFPPLKSLDALPNNLPVQLTSFIGRGSELTEIKQLVQGARLVTLTGVGGTGKTRLALQAAADLLDDFPDGAWLVELAPLADPALMPQTIAAVLTVTEQPGKPLLTTLIDYLRSRRALLILDNCEHLLTAAAALADPLLRSCPHLRILATSREALGITGEAAFHVPSLGLPDAHHVPVPERLQEYEAIRLFVDRATLVQQHFRLTTSNAPAVAQLCRRLDGIPLAIELAAARVKVLPPEEIAARLTDRFRLLTGGSRTALPRQQTLQAAMDWSYNLLPDKERMLLRRLAVFAGSFMLDAVEVVCAGDGIEPHEVLDLVTHLVEKSLILAQPQNGKVPYRMLETVRQYGRERLQESGEADAVRRKHRDFFRTLLERCWSHTALAESAEREMEWLERFEREHDDLRAALDWSLEAAEPEGALRMGAVLWWFWEYRGHFQEGRARLEAVLRADRGPATTARAAALHGAGRLAWEQGDTAGAIELLEEALRLSRQLEFKEGIMRAALTMGLALRSRDLARAQGFFEEALALAREWHVYETGARLGWLWLVVYRRGDYSRAAALAKECAAIVRSYPTVMDPVLVFLGRRAEAWMARREGQYERATGLYDEAVVGSGKLAGSSGRTVLLPWVLVEHASLVQELGDYQRATVILQKSLAISRELGNKEHIAWSLDGLGGVARDTGDFERAAALHQESLALGKDVGPVLVATTLCGLGLAARYKGELDRAQASLEESLRVFKEIGDAVGAAGTIHALGRVAHDRGDHQRASVLIHESLGILKGGAPKLTLVRLLEGLADTDAAKGRFGPAARLLGTAAAAREAMGTPLPPSDRAEHDRTLAAVRAGLGDTASSSVWAEGRAMTLEQAIESALDEEGGGAR